MACFCSYQQCHYAGRMAQLHHHRDRRRIENMGEDVIALWNTRTD
jgi:hypothetical protein